MKYRASQPFTCVSCEVLIIGEPVFHVGLPFCCAGCVAGGPCICSYDEPEDELVAQVVEVHAAADDALDVAAAEETRTLVGAAR